MYSKQIPFKDFQGKPRNMTVHLALSEREVFKLLVPLQNLFSWRDSLVNQAERELTTQEVVDFYNNLEEVLLASWGEPSDDGLHFRKAGRYEFEESALFNATMKLFVTDPTEATKMLEGILPNEGMQEIVQKSQANMTQVAASPETPEAIQARIRELQSQLPESAPTS